ncbi:MAG: hypothetical protein PHD72_02985 [Patescibacteria group bacterium]|nr:hypothetical protein [Patescibacteria group bacterium]
MQIENKDLLTVVGGDCTLRDILDGAVIPDMLSVEDIIFLWPFLSQDRRAELAPQIKHLTGSLPNSPVNFGDWQKFYRDAPPSSFESRLAILEMARLAVSFREWLNVFLFAEADHLPLKRLAAKQLLETAVTQLESNVAMRKYREMFPATMPKEEA